MIVLGLLEASAGQLFQDALARTATTLLAPTGAAFRSLLLRESVDVAIVDPGAGTDNVGADEEHPAALALAKVPYVPFLLFVNGATHSFAHTQSLLHLKPTGVLHRHDSKPASIIAAVREVAKRSLPRRLMAHIEARLVLLPPEMQSVIRRVLEEPDVAETVDDLSVAAGMTRRTFDRRLLRAGLASGQTFLEAGRLAKAFARLHLTDVTCDEVVREMEYSSSQRLRNDSYSVLGIPPTVMRRLSAEEFAGRVGAALLRTDPKGGHASPVVRTSDDLRPVDLRPPRSR